MAPKRVNREKDILKALNTQLWARWKMRKSLDWYGWGPRLDKDFNGRRVANPIKYSDTSVLVSHSNLRVLTGKTWNPKICDRDICAGTEETGNLNAQILLNLPEYPAAPFTLNKNISVMAPRKFYFPLNPPSLPSLLPDPQRELNGSIAQIVKYKTWA